MPKSDEQKKLRNVVFQADAFRISIAMARLVYTRLWQTLTAIEPRFQATGPLHAEVTGLCGCREANGAN